MTAAERAVFHRALDASTACADRLARESALRGEEPPHEAFDVLTALTDMREVLAELERAAHPITAIQGRNA